jgi:hypothetical protein
VIASHPTTGTAILIIEACLAGKDVYCEKPLTLTIREAQLCIEAARKYKRVLQTGSQQRSSVFGQFRLACELIRSGRIGTVKTVHVGVGGPSKWCDLPEEPLEAGLDWERWLGQAPMRPYNSVLSPRGMHNHFPNWRGYREYSVAHSLTWARIISTSHNGLGDGRVGPRSHSARRPKGRHRREVRLCERG